MFARINKWVTQRLKATPAQLAQAASQAARAPFAQDLLEVDEPLWGGFWHGDVISPGYRLPAVELALLRAIRLDQTWPDGTAVDSFLADLRGAITHPDAGIWSLALAGQPCLVFASPAGEARPGCATVAWYCATTHQLHAGYRTTLPDLTLPEALEQRRPGITVATGLVERSDWLEISAQAPAEGSSLAERLDREIVRVRAGK